VPQRYCTICGAELRNGDSFCGKCGSPAHQTAVVATPEADVSVPPLPRVTSSEQVSGPAQSSDRVSDADSKRNAWIALGAVVWGIALLIAVASASGGALLVILIIGLLAFGLYNKGPKGEIRPAGSIPSKDRSGRMVLRSGFDEPVSEAQRSQELEEEIAQYMHDGFFVRQRTATTAQLVRPKKFSFIWALLWFLLFGIGIVVYLIYYAAKQDEGRYVEVDEYGAVKATRQIRHVL